MKATLFSLKALSFYICTFLIGSAFGQTTETFNFTGGMQSWTVPVCVTSIDITIGGAQGGGVGTAGGNNAFGGNGAVVTITIPVTTGQTLDLTVGGQGGVPNAGWPGGGNGHAGQGGSSGSGGGGGYSAVEIGGTLIALAAGGGGAAGGDPSAAGGGGGGCATGVQGPGSVYTGTGGGGGTQVAGGAGGPPWGGGQPGFAGSAFQGGNGGFYSTASGGGGGGGYFGGGGGGSDNCCAFANGGGGGGGGSSFVPAGAGCNQSLNSGDGFITITYNGGITASAANTGPYCEGETIQIQGPGGSPTYIYNWTGPNGFTSNVQNPTIPSATLGMAGTYQLILTDSSCSTDADTAETIVVVNPVPDVDPSPDQLVCHDDLTQLVTFTGSVPGTTFDWTNTNTTTGLGAVGAGDIAAWTGNAIGVVETSTIEVTPSTAFCVGTPDTFDITILPTPEVSVSNDTIICENGTATMTAVGSGGGGGPYTYFWAHTANNDSLQTVDPLVATTYSVYVENIYGCVSLTEDIDVTLHPPLSGNISPFDTICPGYPTDIWANTSGGIGVPYTFTWSTTDTQTGPDNHTIPVNPPQTQTFTVTVTDGCETTPLIMSTEVYVAPLPVPQYEVLDPEQCEPAVFTIVNTTDPNLSEFVYWWVEPNMQYLNVDTIVTDTLMEGFYDIQMIVTTDLGCVDSLTFDDALHVKGQPIANFKHSPNPVLMFNTNVLFQNYSVGAVDYQWFFEGGSPATSQLNNNVQVMFPDGQTGTYDITLIATSELGCSDTMDYELIVFPEILLYAPNTFTPDGDEFNQGWRVFMEGIDLQDFELTIYNRWGQIVWESKDITVEWDGTYGQNGRPVQDGTYTWLIRASDALNDDKYEFNGHINIIR